MSKSFYITLGIIVLASIFIWVGLFKRAVYEFATSLPPLPKPIRHVAYAPGDELIPPPGEAQKNSDVAEVDYNDAGFVPNVITVKAGTTVVFKNKSADSFWPASNPHPAHTTYPTMGGCKASTFDACKQVSPGGEWSFKFDERGSWRYHDHLNPGESGTIVVE